MQSILQPITGFFLGPTPYATFGILLLSIILAFITSLVNKRLLDIPHLRRITAEVQAWSSDYLKAQRTKDNKALEKLNKKKASIDKMRGEMMSQQFKPTLVFAVPLLLLFYVLNTAYHTMVVAWLPFDPVYPFSVWAGHLNGAPYAPFYLWYLICSFTCYQIIQRVMGTSMSIE